MLEAEIGLIGRILFGGVLAVTGVSHFRQTEAMTGYAEAKGLPLPRVGVLASGVLLVAGGAGIAAGVAPVLAGGAVAVFLFVTAVLFHDFWAVPDDQRQAELNHFLKNVAMAGAALVLLAAGGATWAYGLGIGVVG